jgi:hypothetical protein
MKASEALDYYGTKTAAAKALNISRRAFQHRIDTEGRRSAKGDKRPEVGALRFPVLPDKHEPIDRLLDRCEEEYNRNRNYTDAATWQQIDVSERLPIGIAMMGDPHIDDPGCNVPLLRRHAKLIASTEGCYGLNVGDYTNNWVGRLARLFANQDLGQTSARRLTEWLLTGANIKWLAVVLGNHDAWNEGGEIISRMVKLAQHEIPVHDWSAKLELVFPNGATCRINAAHNFKGSSQYSALQGIRKEAIWSQGERAHIMVAGHIHFGEIGQCELPGGFNPWLVRVKGYKEMDSFALVNGFHEGKRFESVMAIIDPNAEEHERVLMFSSLEQGAKVLAAMRATARAEQAKQQRVANPKRRDKRVKAKAKARKTAPQKAKSTKPRGKGRKQGRRA